MEQTFAIARKELRVYLTTGTSYVLMGAFVFIAAFFFRSLILDFQLQALEYKHYGPSATINLTDGVVIPLLLNVTVFFLFLLPILTMRLFAEERRARTLELLMTTPVRPVHIVLGKYLAAASIMTMMLVLTLLFPVLLYAYGATGVDGAPALEWNTIATGYLGLFLLGAAFVAVGCLTSSFTESQIIAVVIGFSLLLVFYVIGIQAPTAGSGFWQVVLRHVALSTHLEYLLRGLLRVSDVVYFLSLIAFALFLTHRMVDAQRWR